MSTNLAVVNVVVAENDGSFLSFFSYLGCGWIWLDRWVDEWMDVWICGWVCGWDGWRDVACV